MSDGVVVPGIIPFNSVYLPENFLPSQPANFYVIKNTVYIFAGRFSNAVFLFLLTLVVSRQLGPALFGVYSLLITIVIAANCFSNFGFDIRGSIGIRTLYRKNAFNGNPATSDGGL